MKRCMTRSRQDFQNLAYLMGQQHDNFWNVSNLAKKMSWQKKTCVCCCAWKSSPRQVECGTVNHALS